jgi:hypothetical protein
MRKIFFDFFVNPLHTGVHKEKILNELFETCMVPACSGWVIDMKIRRQSGVWQTIAAILSIQSIFFPLQFCPTSLKIYRRVDGCFAR